MHLRLLPILAALALGCSPAPAGSDSGVPGDGGSDAGGGSGGGGSGGGTGGGTGGGSAVENWAVDVIACAAPNANPCPQPIAGATIQLHYADGYHSQTADSNGYTVWAVTSELPQSDTLISATGYVTTGAHIDVAATHDGRAHNVVYVPRAHRDPATVTEATLRHVLADFGGIAVPSIAPQCPEDPVTQIRCTGDNGGIPHGLIAGALFTAAYFVYTPEQRRAIREAYSARGYTHFPISVFANPDRSYHSVYPASTPDGAQLNAFLQELWDNDGRAQPIIPICFVMADWEDAVSLPAGFDKSLCRIVVPKWEQDGPDNNDTAAINRHGLQVRAAFPNALLYFHFTSAHFAGGTPEADWWTWAVTDAAGPHAIGFLYQDDWTDSAAVRGRVSDLLIRLGGGYHGWPHPVDVVLFETDIYPKFWDGRTEAEGVQYNDAILTPLYKNTSCFSESGQQYCGRLAGFGSGGTP